jgi:hypothetical protein
MSELNQERIVWTALGLGVGVIVWSFATDTPAINFVAIPLLSAPIIQSIVKHLNRNKPPRSDS